jgi:uncharacterized protein (TIGR01244 family)
VLVAGQIAPGDVAAAAAEGVTTIVNNRPDGEQPGQPAGADIEKAARALGLDYRAIPVRGGIGPQQVAEMADVLAGSEGKILAYCASGTRSTWLWAIASSQAGGDTEEIIRKAAQAGYDLTPLRAQL